MNYEHGVFMCQFYPCTYIHFMYRLVKEHEKTCEYRKGR